VAGLRNLGFVVETGVFRTAMQVELVNDGPVTLLLDTDEWKLAHAEERRPLSAGNDYNLL
jgi:hypothetical protein